MIVDALIAMAPIAIGSQPHGADSGGDRCQQVVRHCPVR
jgi:hypothetical protein